MLLRIICCLFGLIMTNIAQANYQTANNFMQAVKDGSAELAFRPRYENSKQQGLLNAQATTLRTTVGYETADFYQSTFKVELVDVANFFGIHYNPNVSDLSLPQYTTIADPSGAGITEAKLIYNGFNQNEIVLGRQYIQLDNERFIGKNDHRQYPQSFDAISLNNTYFKNLDIFYAFVFYVNTNNANGRALDARHRLTTNLFNVDWTNEKFGTISGYVYFNDDHTTNINSTTTFGMHINSPADLTQTDNYAYYLEIARQQSKFNNPNNYTAYYVHCILSKTIKIFTASLGYENLGGKYITNHVFNTPLGSVDNFDGYAEAFTTPPTGGLQDAYLMLNFTYLKLTGGITWHYFRLDNAPSSKSAGSELDLYANVTLTRQIDLNICYAKYNAKHAVAPSTRRFWIMLVGNFL